jgi:hypothetical protein
MPNHGSRIHLGSKLRLRMGDVLEPLCGQTLTVGIGARRIHESEWETMHESLRCQRCVRAYEAHPG